MDAWYTNELSPNAASKQQTYCWNIHTHVYIENFPGLSQHTFPQAAHVHIHVHVIAHTCLTSALRLLRSAWAIRERMRECSSTHSIDFWSTGEENYDRPTHVNKKNMGFMHNSRLWSAPSSFDLPIFCLRLIGCIFHSVQKSLVNVSGHMRMKWLPIH